MATKCPEPKQIRPLRICDNVHFLSSGYDLLKGQYISPSHLRRFYLIFYICMKYTLCVPHLTCEITKIKRKR